MIFGKGAAADSEPRGRPVPKVRVPTPPEPAAVSPKPREFRWPSWLAPVTDPFATSGGRSRTSLSRRSR